MCMYLKESIASNRMQILSQYLDQTSCIEARAVCKAWAHAFGSQVLQVQLKQPMSQQTACTLARKAAAAFTSTQQLNVQLFYSCTARGAERPAAAVALLRPFGQMQSLQRLQLKLRNGPCTMLGKVLPLLPQLQVLDLAECHHLPSDLLVIAQHLRQLRQLVLHYSGFTTLGGRRVKHDGGWGHGDREAQFWGNSCTNYKAEHVSALAALPHLSLLECPLPRGDQQQGINLCGAIASLTTLSALHIIEGAHYPRTVAAADLVCLSSLTGLTHLKCGAGVIERISPWNACHGQQQARHWRALLPHLQQLQRLCLCSVHLTDDLLRVLGAATSLDQLVLGLGTRAFDASASAEGAAAVACVPSIELHAAKWTDDADRMQPLVQLPNVKRIVCHSQYGREHWPERGGMPMVVVGRKLYCISSIAPHTGPLEERSWPYWGL